MKTKSSLKFLSLALTALASASVLAAETASAPSASLNDGEIAAVVMAANKVDISGGKLAEARAQDQKVKHFGKHMVMDHAKMNKEALALAKKLDLKAEPNATSKALLADGEKSATELKAKSGKAFDVAYLDNEIATHQKVLDTIDHALLPNAKNGELKAMLEKARPVVAEHLQDAKKIRESMNNAG